jgi:hypothetical protein
VIFLSLMLFSFMPKRPQHFGFIAGTRVGFVSMAVTRGGGGVLLVVKVGRAITFGPKMTTG